MKTKDVPAIIMLLAGGVYCVIGILYQIPLMIYLMQLLLVLLIFWMLGGIAKAVLDHFIGEIEEKTEEEEEDEESEDEEESEEKKEDDESESSETDKEVASEDA